jgi:hypothetical protein
LTPEERRKRRARREARRRLEARLADLERENAELRARRMAPAAPPISAMPTRDEAATLVERLSFGFGKPVARREPPLSPAASAQAPATDAPATPAPVPAAAPARVDLGPIERRLAAIESKLDEALARGSGLGEDEGVPSKFRDGRRAGLDARDGKYREKSAILRKLLEDNVRLQKGGGTHGTQG